MERSGVARGSMKKAVYQPFSECVSEETDRLTAGLTLGEFHLVRLRDALADAVERVLTHFFQSRQRQTPITDSYESVNEGV